MTGQTAIAQIKTFKELFELMKTVDPTATKDDVYRLCGMIEADTVRHLNQRDLINMFVEGFKGFKKPSDVVKYIETLGFGDEHLTEEQMMEVIASKQSVCFPTRVTMLEYANDYFGKSVEENEDE